MNVSSETFNLMNTNRLHKDLSRVTMTITDFGMFVHSYPIAWDVVMTYLKNRLARSTAALRKLLFVFGLDFTSDSKWTKIWSGFCYLLVFQANLYVLLDRSHNHIKGSLVNMDHLITLLDKFIRFLSISLIHLTFILKFRQNLNAFCYNLELVDFRLHRPNFMSKIRYASIVGVVWTLIMCNVQTLCAMYWEFFARRTTPSIFWVEIIQQVIRIESFLFFDLFVVVFWICGQLVVKYYETLIDDSKSCVSTKNEFLRFASLVPRISSAATLLGSQFSLICSIICVHSFCCLIFFADGIVSQVRDRDLKILVAWDTILLIGCLIRLWLLCQTADRIRYAAVECIRCLRRLRNDCSSNTFHTSQRIKITLVMVELIKTLPSFELLSLATLSKKLALRVLETTVAYLLMLSEIRLQKKFSRTHV